MIHFRNAYGESHPLCDHLVIVRHVTDDIDRVTCANCMKAYMANQTEPPGMKWIKAEEIDQKPGQVTRRWVIQTTDGAVILGLVHWYAPWRKYAYFPTAGTLYEPDCLRDLAQFCQDKTEERKAERVRR